MYSTQLLAQLATHQHHQSNYSAILDEVDPADDVTVMVPNKGKAGDDATLTTENGQMKRALIMKMCHGNTLFPSSR